MENSRKEPRRKKEKERGKQTKRTKEGGRTHEEALNKRRMKIKIIKVRIVVYSKDPDETNFL